MFYKDTILEYLCVCYSMIIRVFMHKNTHKSTQSYAGLASVSWGVRVVKSQERNFRESTHKTLRDLRVSFVLISSRSSCLIRVDNLDEICYNIRITQLDLFEILIMYSQLDYELDSHLDSSYSYTCHLDDHDEIYARRDTSYETLALRHHVWYNVNT